MKGITVKRAEVLAPCGSLECVNAALRGNADAVYLGCGEFNARRNAENFTFDTLKTAVELCHAKGVKVYLTLNTLVFPEEIKSALQTAVLAAKANVDAFILQDLGLAELIKQAVPDMPLHASTQTSVHSVEGARRLFESGFSRVVLAREMSENEIREIHEALPELELEYFVHGALCMSVSGQCYFSAFLGDRSGNRGLCAQTCRLPFEINRNQSALSLKDLSLVSRVSSLIVAGVTSLKIEGRMKRPEYVAIASRTVKAAVNGLDFDTENELLKKVFSRSGFTDGYFNADRTEEMFGIRRKEDAENLSDALSEINRITRNPSPSLPCRAVLTAKENTALELKVSDGENSNEVTLYGGICEKAKNPLNEEKLLSSLTQTGNDAYYIRDVKLVTEGEPFVPLSEVKNLRREALSALVSKRFEKKTVKEISPVFVRDEREYDEYYVIRAESFDTLPDNLPAGCRVILPLDELVKKASFTRLLKEKGHVLCAELPRLIFSKKAEENAVSLMKKAKETGVTEALCHNVGHISLIASASLTPFGSFGLNITNPYSYGFYRDNGVENTFLSFELTLKQIGSFADRRHTLFCYGRVPVMMSRACVNLGKRGCADCKKGSLLTDRMKQQFPVLCRKGYCEILNSRPLYMGDKKEDLLNAGISSFALWFTKETKEEAESVVFDFVTSSPFSREFTRGLYYRKEK